jgi:hypothetical protein
VTEGSGDVAFFFECRYVVLDNLGQTMGCASWNYADSTAQTFQI